MIHSACKTLAIGLKAGQGRLGLGTLVTLDGERALTPARAAGVLDHSIDTDVWEDGGVLTIYTGGRFLWKAVVEANPGMVFDRLTISGLKAKGISFEAINRIDTASEDRMSTSQLRLTHFGSHTSLDFSLILL